MKSRDFEKFRYEKVKKIRNKLAANPIRLNLITFQLHFLRRFQNWFQIFDTCSIHRETTSLPMKSLDIESGAK